MATNKKTSTKKEYVLRITTTDLNPFLYVRKNRIEGIQFKACLYKTTNLSDVILMKPWIKSGQIELIQDGENLDVVKNKAKNTTNQYFGEKDQSFDEINGDIDLSSIMEG